VGDGDGEEEKLGGQQEGEGSKRCWRTSIRGDAVEGQWTEGGKATLTEYDLYKCIYIYIYTYIYMYIYIYIYI